MSSCTCGRAPSPGPAELMRVTHCSRMLAAEQPQLPSRQPLGRMRAWWRQQPAHSRSGTPMGHQLAAWHAAQALVRLRPKSTVPDYCARLLHDLGLKVSGATVVRGLDLLHETLKKVTKQARSPRARTHARPRPSAAAGCRTGSGERRHPGQDYWAWHIFSAEIFLRNCGCHWRVSVTLAFASAIECLFFAFFCTFLSALPRPPSSDSTCTPRAGFAEAHGHERPAPVGVHDVDDGRGLQEHRFYGRGGHERV